MILKTSLHGHVYTFQSVKDVLAKANEEKSGTGWRHCRRERRGAGGGQSGDGQPAAVRLRENPAVPYEEDEVTRIIQDDVKRENLRRNPQLDRVRAAGVAAGREAHRRGHPPHLPGPDRRDDRRRDQDYEQPGPDLRGQKAAGHRHLQHHHRRGGHPVLPPPAQPPHRRPRRHHGLPAGGPDLRRGGRGAGPQPGGRQRGERAAGAGPVSTRSAPAGRSPPRSAFWPT